MNEAVETLDGWYCLHDFRTIDWLSWRNASAAEQSAALEELQTLRNGWEDVQTNELGSHAIYSIVGQKADLMLLFLRPTMEALNEIETAFNKSLFAGFLLPSYSYVSVVELSNYLEKTEDPYQNPMIRARLYPILPKMKHVCFYPMNKSRHLSDNWYMLPMEERRPMIASHGQIGRKYAGIVKQIVSGSMGFEDWEWGVTLFSDDVLQFKKIVSEMRFDEASARFGEFGTFFVGNIIEEDGLADFFHI